MDHLIGIKGNGFVLLAADTSASRSIVMFKENEDKILALDKFKMIATNGPIGDRKHFTEYVEKNVHLYQLRTGLPLSTHAVANFTRLTLAEALRSNPYQVNLLIGGYDEKKGASLYFMDYLASMHPVDKAAHGYCSFFCLSILDRYCKKDMSLEEAKDVLRKCFKEINTRMTVRVPVFKIKVVDKDGIREIEL